MGIAILSIKIQQDSSQIARLGGAKNIYSHPEMFRAFPVVMKKKENTAIL